MWHKNYSQLVKGIINLGLEPLFPNIDSECVPQWMPIKDPSKKLTIFLRENGVGAIYWPWYELPKEVAYNVNKYPISNKLNKTLTLLPIHHSLKSYDINHILELIKKCNQ